jgi:hypothetical protein
MAKLNDYELQDFVPHDAKVLEWGNLMIRAALLLLLMSTQSLAQSATLYSHHSETGGACTGNNIQALKVDLSSFEPSDIVIRGAAVSFFSNMRVFGDVFMGNVSTPDIMVKARFGDESAVNAVNWFPYPLGMPLSLSGYFDVYVNCSPPPALFSVSGMIFYTKGSQ